MIKNKDGAASGFLATAAAPPSGWLVALIVYTHAGMQWARGGGAGSQLLTGHLPGDE
jgi:hypothetical protein